MERYDEGCLRRAEQRVEDIRNRALEKARQINPAVLHVMDCRRMDDYLVKNWDYPGMWYVGFQLPAGFKTEESLIDAIAAETVAYYRGRR